MKIIAIEPFVVNKEKAISVERIFDAAFLNYKEYETAPRNANECIERIADAEVAIVVNFPITAEIINACPKLKLIAVAFSGYDHIDLQACKLNHISVCNAPGYSTHAVAELTIGMIISVLRSIPTMDFATRTLKTRNGFLGNELFGKTLGIIGTGKIGSQVALLARAFGCEVLAYNRSQKEDLKNAKIKYVSLEQLLIESDIISLHIPLNPETHHLIDKEQIMLMKPEAIIVNTARGGLINTHALAVALKVKRIAGAALDVYDYEPPLPKDFAMREYPFTVLLPHIGYATHEAINRRTDIVVENILSWVDKKPINLVSA